jgi:type VI secretion system secreted protein VgrG
MQRSGEVVEAAADGYSAPHMQLSAPSGIAAVTPADAVFSVGASTALCAGQDLNVASQGSSLYSVKNGISLFSYGKATNANKPAKETGIRLHAASGKVSSQSQSGPSRLTADKMITVASVTKSVTVGARKHVLLTAQGACLKLEGGNIELHGPGKIEFKATMKELAGPASSSFHMPSLPKTDQPVSFDKPVFSQQFDLSHLALNDGLAFSSKRLPYTVYDKTGKFVALGITDENGLTNRIFTNEQTELVLLAGDGQWQVEEYFESDDWNDNKFDNMG